MKLDLNNCQCAICAQALQNGENQERKWLKEYGFYAHFVIDACDSPNHTNIHTHGIFEHFDHPDFQICIGVRQQTAMGLFHNLVEAIKDFKTFEAGIKYPDIANYDTEFIEAIECGRKVLRMVICNPQGTFEGDIYQAQFTKTGMEKN